MRDEGNGNQEIEAAGRRRRCVNFRFPFSSLLVVAALGGCAQMRDLWARIAPGGSTSSEPAPAATTAHPAARGCGALLLSGGGRTAGAVVAEAARLTAGAPARVVIVPGQTNRADAGRAEAETWRKAGFSDVEILDAADAARAAAQLDAATFVWLAGGEPAATIRRLADSGLAARIRARFDAGALVGGTNAGASATAELMIVGGDESEMQQRRVETVGGLGLWRGVIVDEHFVAKKQFNRLMAAVLDHPQFVGVGIDEDTGVVVENGTLRVVGENNVVVIDARRATVNASRPGDASSATGVAVQVLAGGMTYDLAAR